ncbi:MAG: hypothetical protein HIU88_14200 [Acidobacteria bacterium]|nr:hypothetical protein [Acidobacteriota bacterium]
MKVRWSSAPEPHDYPAAQSYLGLLTDPDAAAQLVRLLSTQPITLHKAKDILRAARLPLLALDDPYVAGDLKRIRAGKKLSPVLLVRGDLNGAPLLIADGYHRVCASYHLSEDADVSAQLVARVV